MTLAFKIIQDKTSLGDPRITANLVGWHNFQVRTVCHEDLPKSYQDLDLMDGIEIHSTLYTSNYDGTKTWGYHHTESRRYSLSVDSIITLGKVLSKLTKALDAMAMKRGDSSGLGEYLTRVAEILGVETFLVQDKYQGWRTMNGNEARYWIERKQADLLLPAAPLALQAST